ncbi:complexin-3 [Danio aesculapii]|uniref:complexin-3 n=1 Tax=Danio aesculapii TaxID=1142201 RepID=UPI0024BF77D0|nr:complexin-3 [Danio aesculapii]
MSAVVKKSLGAPLRQLTSCVTGDQDACSRKGKAVRRKSAPCCYGPTAHDSSWLRTYQAELHKERKHRQVKFAQKNAERAAMRVHYRSPHRYAKAPVQRTNLNSKTSSKNDNSLFGAFQGLSLNLNAAQASITNSVQYLR